MIIYRPALKSRAQPGFFKRKGGGGSHYQNKSTHQIVMSFPPPVAGLLKETGKGFSLLYCL